MWWLPISPSTGGYRAPRSPNTPYTGAWILFLILFVWQHPHFYAIAWMYKEDYARAGFKMLPVVHPDGVRTFRQTVGFSILMLPVSVLPYFFGMAGPIYLVGIVALGVVMLLSSIKLWRTHAVSDARALLKISVIYLPLFFALLLCDSSL